MVLCQVICFALWLLQTMYRTDLLLLFFFFWHKLLYKMWSCDFFIYIFILAWSFHKFMKFCYCDKQLKCTCIVYASSIFFVIYHVYQNTGAMQAVVFFDSERIFYIFIKIKMFKTYIFVGIFLTIPNWLQDPAESSINMINVLKFCTPKFLIKRSMQPVQTQIRLLLKEQSDLGLHCLPFH